MTRLKTSDIVGIARSLEQYDKELREKTGCNLLEIAEDAANTKKHMRTTLEKSAAAAVPITSGQGVIEGFSEAVAAILNHIGLRTIITREADEVGIAEAYEKGAKLIFIADDRKFVAINTHSMRVVDNAISTAKAYVAVLGRMTRGLTGKSVLVIGVGNIGTATISELLLRKAKPIAVDSDESKLKNLKTEFGRNVVVLHSFADALRKTNLIINTAPARNIINANMIRENTLISTPAIPLCLTDAAVRKVGKNLVHDPLQLGVATMAVEACAK